MILKTNDRSKLEKLRKNKDESNTIETFQHISTNELNEKNKRIFLS